MGTKRLSAELNTLAAEFYRAIGTPTASALLRALERQEWDTIAMCKVDPRAYTSDQDYFLDATVASVLKKCKDLPSSFDRRASALANWKAGEDDCFKTNERLAPYLEGRTHPDFNGDVGQHIAGIREKIRVVLGRCPRMEDLDPRHGPGATFSDKSLRSTLADKMESKASITTGALWFLLDWIGTAWGREALSRTCDPLFVRGNRFSTAPKDATKDRPIAAEPSVNIFYQLALGQQVRRRLKRVGIDLELGQDTHRRLACESSIAGHLATLDLKNASDTVAYSLVKLLLPPDWFVLFDELRSPFTRMSDADARLLNAGKTSLSDTWVRLEKFSSMGNGFTFELETLLFWAISDYACSQAVSEGLEKTFVYGDDIICDTRGVRAVISALRFFGFRLNEEKSFWDGPFRESCGGDFWNGRPVRPYFQKDPLDEPHQLIAAANQIRRLAHDLFGGLGPLDRAWRAIQDHLPIRVRRCRGPNRLGDVVIHDDEVNWSWTSSAKDRIFSWRPVAYRKVSLRVFSDGTVFACGLYGLTVSDGWINPRESVIGHDVRRTLIYGIDWLPKPVIRTWRVDELPISSGRRGPDYSGFPRVVRRSGDKARLIVPTDWYQFKYWP